MYPFPVFSMSLSGLISHFAEHKTSIGRDMEKKSNMGFFHGAGSLKFGIAVSCITKKPEVDELYLTLSIGELYFIFIYQLRSFVT
jgi:hypothetical protein